MNNREKKLLIALVVVAIGAGVFLLLDSSPSRKTLPKEQPATASTTTPSFDVKQFPKLEKQVVAIELTPSQKKILAQSSIPWQKDIFYKDSPKKEFSVHTQKKKVETKLFSYTGFIQLGDELFAIINNRNYKEGDSLEDWAGYSVGKITKKNVVIYTPKKNALVISYTNREPFVWEPPQKKQTPQQNEKKKTPGK